MFGPTGTGALMYGGGGAIGPHTFSAGGGYAGQNMGFAAGGDFGSARGTPQFYTPPNPALDFQKSKFNQIFGLLKGGLGGQPQGPNQFGQNFAGGAGFGAGFGGFQPAITAGPVWSPQQIQQQVNLSRAHNDQATGGQIQGMQSQMAGRGFGSNSPLSQALGAMMQGQNLATNTEAANNLRWGAAQGNANQMLKSQVAQEGQFANRQQEAIERQKIAAQQQMAAMGQQNALLSALAGMM